MTKHPRHPFLFGPTPIAIHDDGDVLWNIFEGNLRLKVRHISGRPDHGPCCVDMSAMSDKKPLWVFTLNGYLFEVPPSGIPNRHRCTSTLKSLQRYIEMRI
jgi:hypothetical protein